MTATVWASTPVAVVVTEETTLGSWMGSGAADEGGRRVNASQVQGYGLSSHGQFRMMVKQRLLTRDRGERRQPDEACPNPPRQGRIAQSGKS
jgi:hypothetical protein